MRNKRLLAILSIMIYMIFTVITFMYVKQASRNWYRKVEITNYTFEISYPRSYEDIKKEETNIDNISSKITTTITEIEKDTEVSMNFVEELVHAKSDISGMTMLIEGIKKEKSPKSIEEICKDYITMFKVFNESLTVLTSNYEQTTIDGKDVGKVKIIVEGKTEGINAGMISYLIPLDDREITIAFTGTEEMFNINSKEIDKIINSVKLH